MSSLNKVEIIGRLGNDPEMRSLPNGEAVATLSVATSESWVDKISGERKEKTEWHRVVFYGRLAEVSGQYLKKGGLIYIEGKLTTKEYTDKQNIKRYMTEIQGRNLLMLSNTNTQAKSPVQNSEPVSDHLSQDNRNGLDDIEF